MTSSLVFTIGGVLIVFFLYTFFTVYRGFIFILLPNLFNIMIHDLIWNKYE